MESHTFYFSFMWRSKNCWSAQFGGLLLVEGALMEHRAVTPERLRLMKRQVVHRLRSRSSEHRYFFCLFITDVKQSRGPWYEQNALSFFLKCIPISLHKVIALYYFFLTYAVVIPQMVELPFKYSWKKRTFSDSIVGNTVFPLDVQLQQNMSSHGTFLRHFQIRSHVPTFPFNLRASLTLTLRKCGNRGVISNSTWGVCIVFYTRHRQEWFFYFLFFFKWEVVQTSRE